MSDLIERLRGYTLDWNGSEMADDAPALTDVKCGLLREAATRIEALEAELQQKKDADLGRYIFAWFNDLDCDEMRRCLETYDARQSHAHLLTPESDNG